MRRDASVAGGPLVTREHIERGLRDLGVRPGHILEVHGSLSAFGYVEGGAAVVIDALIARVGDEGAVVMSAYPLGRPMRLTPEERARRIAWKCGVLPADSPERTAMGAIADTFKRRADVVCGQGVHRVCAWGRNKEQLTDEYRTLVERGGHVLLLGVGIDRCSSLHLADEIPVPQEIAAYWELPADVRADYPEDQWSVGLGETPDDAWGKVYRAADGAGLIRHARFGNAECHFFRASEVVRMLAEWRRADPHGLYGVPRPTNRLRTHPSAR
jgi:aminoglycoside N3'-acetyltransferase